MTLNWNQELGNFVTTVTPVGLLLKAAVAWYLLGPLGGMAGRNHRLMITTNLESLQKRDHMLTWSGHASGDKYVNFQVGCNRQFWPRPIWTLTCLSPEVQPPHSEYEVLLETSNNVNFQAGRNHNEQSQSGNLHACLELFEFCFSSSFDGVSSSGPPPPPSQSKFRLRNTWPHFIWKTF